MRWIYLGRGFRSFTLGFTSVIFPLYLAQAGYSAIQIGETLTASGVMSALLVGLVGFGSDRYGRRNIIILLSIFSILGSLSLAITPLFFAVALASGLSGIGRGGGAGSGGAFGPIFPAEQPLVAASTPPSDRTRVFGVLSFIGVMAGALGSLVAGLPSWLHALGWSWIASYHLLFYGAAVMSVVMVAVSLPLREPEQPPPAASAPVRQAASMKSGQILGRLGLTNALNGFGFGFLGPLMTYWFYRRFGVGPAELGFLYAIVNVASALPYLGAAWLTQRMGPVLTVSVTRLVAAFLLLMMVFTPTFWLTGSFYALRMMVNSLGQPARQSWVMGASEERKRGRMAAFSSLPAQATSMISPTVGGALMSIFLDTPIIGGTFFFTLNAILYFYAFRHVTLHEEPHSSTA